MTISSGIYCFINLLNGDRYIGQSLDIKNRIATHKYKTKKVPETHFYFALQKYGFENFDITILEECSEEQLTVKEQEWIDHFESLNVQLYNKIPAQNNAARVNKRIVNCEVCQTEMLLSEKRIARNPTCGKVCGNIRSSQKRSLIVRTSKYKTAEDKKAAADAAAKRFREKNRKNGLNADGSIPRGPAPVNGILNPNYRHGKYVKPGEELK